MFCSNCATQIKPELNYCNSCGMRIEKGLEEINGSLVKNLSTAVGFIGVFGLSGFIFLIKVLLENQVVEGLIFALAFLYLGTIFGISSLLIRLIANDVKNKSEVKFQSDFPNKQIKSVATNQLEEPRQPFASVTVDTTRTLEEVPLKRS